MKRKTPVCLLLVSLLTATIGLWMMRPVEAGSDVLELKYDNGVPSDSGYGHTFNTGVGVRFTSPYPLELTGAKFYFVPGAEGTQSNFTLRVEDAAHNTLVSFLVSYTYHNVPLPRLEGTIVNVDLKDYHIVVSGDFYIFAINHHCIWVDTSPVGSWRNYFYDGHGNYIQYEKYGEGSHGYGNLMIRAYVIAPLGINQLNTLLLYAPANKAYFIYADPAHMTRAEATYDVASGEIVRSLCANTQHYGFNTTRHWLLPSGAINTTTIHGATIAMFGSRCPNVAVKYYEEVANLTPILFKINGTYLWFEDRTGAYLGGLPWSVIQAPNYHEDMFTVMAFTDGVNTFFFAYGIDWKGTWAGGIYFKEVISKNLSNYPKTYYVFHWVDDSGQDGIPQSLEIHEEASG